MRALVIGTLFATLIGCCPIPPQAVSKACASKSCPARTAASSQTELKRPSFKPNPVTTKMNVTTATETSKLSPTEQGSRTGPAEKEAAIPTTPTADTPAAVQPAEPPDSILKKAKATIAAKLEDPASAEFADMKRAIRKDTIGESVDTICGHVKGKKASGEETGERPFLYLVKDDKAFVDDGNPNSPAATAYRAICTP